MADFLINAIIIGITIALIAGPLGAFTVWKKMAYFGDTLAHSALIGVAAGLFLEVNLSLAIIVCCAILASLLVVLQQNHALSTDTLLGVLSHGSLAVGLICVSLYSDQRINLFGYLFGDFLTVTSDEIYTILAATTVIAILLAIYWKPLLMIAIDEDLARVEGHPVGRLKWLLMLMIASIIALAMKIVGVLLITALLIIPAATSRRLASSPEAMAVIASLLGTFAVLIGIAGSYWWDLPAGPAVVLAALLSFTLSLSIRERTNQ